MTEDKPNVFLDLDNTLLSAVPIAEIKWDKDNLDLATEFPFHNMENYYLVFERPGLQDFLDFLFTNFNVSVWSAATKDYVLFIVDRILLQKPNRKLKYIMFSYHCDRCKEEKKGSVKLLDFLWTKYALPGITKSNTFIIDDNDRVAGFNSDNVVHIKEFEFEDGKPCIKDRELQKLQKCLQNILEDYAKTRCINKELLLKACSAPDDRRQTALRYAVTPPTTDEGEEEEQEEEHDPDREQDTSDDFEKERSFLQDEDEKDRSILQEDDEKERSILLDEDEKNSSVVLDGLEQTRSDELTDPDADNKDASFVVEDEHDAKSTE